MNTTETNTTYARLKEPLPATAVKPHPTKGYLDTINPAYVIDRLNEVFGLGGWSIDYEIISASEQMVIAKGILEIPGNGVRVVQFGGNDNSDKGDAYKGACTDALTKCASYIGIGLHVWMDDKRPTGGNRQQTAPSGERHAAPRNESYAHNRSSSSGTPATANQVSLINRLCSSSKIPSSEKHMIQEQLQRGMNKRQASEAIDRLQGYTKQNGQNSPSGPENIPAYHPDPGTMYQ